MRASFKLVSTLFVLSGMTGLIYEVAFSKTLSTIFGATAYAVSSVLSAFMGGLALGAYVGGHVSSRTKRPLLAYGVAEILVGLVCALTPFAFAAIERIYVTIGEDSSLTMVTALRSSMTFLVIFVPTCCMGATLPLLSRVLQADEGAEKHTRLPVLYAMNTIGGALGALSCAYVVLPWLGVRGAMRGAALVNLVLGLVAMFAGRNVVVPKLEKVKTPVDSEKLGLDLLVLAFFSGLLVFAAEVVEVHLLTLLIGNSAYAFGLMLAVFLVCLGIGAARSRAFLAKHGERALPRGLMLAAIAHLVTLPLWDRLPHLFVFAGKHVDSWAGRELVRALAALAVLSAPAVFMGTTFPLLLARVAKRVRVGEAVGKLTVANTVGTIVGSLVTGYVVLPLLGSQKTLLVVAFLFAIMAVVAARATEAMKTSVIGLAVIAVAAAIMPAWNVARLTNGANVYFGHGPEPDAIPFVREDVHGGVTTVALRGALHTMYTNGKFQGDDGPEMMAQRRFAHYPSLFVEDPKNALVIGLGTGTTLGTVTAYPYEHIDVAEISPAIVEAARLYYGGPSRNALDDPRVKLQLNDGRNILLLGKTRYDLITIELTSVWFAGASNLYSREFYELTQRRLTEGGILQQWVQLHHIRPRELAAIVKTIHSVYPHVALFEGGSQGILVASKRPLVASAKRLRERSQDPHIRATLDTPELEDLLHELILSDSDLERLTQSVARETDVPLSTDDNLFLEYATPRGNVLSYGASLEASLELLHRFRTEDVRGRHLGP